MKILLDLSPIKSGGGAQLALNFIEKLKKCERDFQCDFLASDAFPFKDRLPKNKTIIAPSKYLNRILFENLKLKKIVRRKKYTHIYTFFGPGLPSYKGVRQIVGVAYPIICYDESKYWNNLSLDKFVTKKLLNYYRKRRLKKADFLIFETKIMQERCVSTLGFDKQKTLVLPPSPTVFLTDNDYVESSGVTKFLILSGTDTHKNIWRLIPLIKRAASDGLKFKIIASVKIEQFFSEYRKHILVSDDYCLLDKYFEFLGPIPQDKIQEVYDRIDVVLNISDLESFSNNYMEAWRCAKPILASDRDFSRHICRESAIYCEPHDLDSLYESIRKFVYKEYDVKSMVVCGKRYLAELPSVEQKIESLIKVFNI